MRTAWPAAVGLLCTATILPGQQASPASKWIVDAAATRCSLIRVFDSPSKLTLSLWTVPGTNYLNVAMRGADLPTHPSGSRVPVSLRLHGTDVRLDRTATAGSSSRENGASLLIGSLGLHAIEAFGRASSFSIVDGSMTIGPFAIPSAAKATGALGKCVDLQLSDWGADPVQFQPGGSRAMPIGDPERWLSNNQLMAIRFEGGELHAVLRLSVGSDGRVDGCAQVEPKSGGDVERTACKPLLSRALFTPAKDGTGRPVRGAAAYEIRLARSGGTR